MALANAERRRATGSGGRLASPGSGTAGRPTAGRGTAVERRPHEEQPGATRQPVSVRLLRRRRACRLREPQLAESLVGSATERCSSKSAIWTVVLFEHTAVTAGARVESQVPNGRDRPLNVAALRRAFHFAEIRVPHPRNACSTSPKYASSRARTLTAGYSPSTARRNSSRCPALRWGTPAAIAPRYRGRRPSIGVVDLVEGCPQTAPSAPPNSPCASCQPPPQRWRRRTPPARPRPTSR